MTGEVVTTAEAGAILGITPQAVRLMVARGALTAVRKVPGSKAIVIDRAQVEAATMRRRGGNDEGEADETGWVDGTCRHCDVAIFQMTPGGLWRHRAPMYGLYACDWSVDGGTVAEPLPLPRQPRATEATP